MIWILIMGLVVGLVWFVFPRKRSYASGRGRDKGEGNADNARYKNRSSRRRDEQD